MRFDIITLFPELIEPFLHAGVTRRAFERGAEQSAPKMDVRLWQLRDYAQGNYKRVDDRPFGGGPGMVMMAEPLLACLCAIERDRSAPSASTGSSVTGEMAVPPAASSPVVLFSPVGPSLNQRTLESWMQPSSPFCRGATLICGRYEGVDQRFIDAYVTHQLSLGDFVLSGGEIAAVALLDGLARLHPQVLNDEESHRQDSFNSAIGGLLDCPHYTRPEVWQNMTTPSVLLSGDHRKIEDWRHHQRLDLTQKMRPDLAARL